MLTTQIEAGAALWLLVGNGPSAWSVSSATIKAARRAANGRLRVVVCNLAGLSVDCDFVACQDVAVLRQLLDQGVHRRAVVMANHGAVVSLQLERGALPDGVIDGGNLLVFPAAANGTSTGDAVFHSLCVAGAREIALIGFDGSNDQRTRFAGSPGYRTHPTAKHQFVEWERRMAASVRNAAREHGSSPRVIIVRLQKETLEETELEKLAAWTWLLNDADAAASALVMACEGAQTCRR